MKKIMSATLLTVAMFSTGCSTQNNIQVQPESAALYTSAAAFKKFNLNEFLITT